MSTSQFVNSHFVNIDQMGIDKVGIDEVGIDEVGIDEVGNILLTLHMRLATHQKSVNMHSQNDVRQKIIIMLIYPI